MPQFPAAITLSSLDGTNGFQISGGLGNHALTATVAAGDINGDGFDDLIIGDPYTDGYTGAAYVVFGKSWGFPANLVLSSLDGSNGFKIAGRPAYFGGSVASAGDVNGDGFADLIIGATGFSPPGRYVGGAAFVVFGAASGFGASFKISSLNGSNGFEIDGAAALDGAGWPVSSAGDVNGDGFADVIVSAQPHTGPNNSPGASYVVFGRATGFGASLNVSSLDGSNGFTITGEMPGDYSHAVASAGDFNGDGFSDLLIGAKNASYVVFGKASGFGANLNLSNLNGSNGFKLNNVGRIAFAGDVNRDGFGDLIIGDSGGGANAAGTSYVVFGNASGFPDLSRLNGSNGFQIQGEAAGDHSGATVGSAGDVNGDGFDDVIIGAPNADPNGINSGASYVVFGKASGFAASLALSSLDGTNGFKIAGAAPADFSGWSVSSAGDVNGDGVADIAISASPNRSYVVFGHSTGTTETSSLSEGDFNGDGKADVLWRNNNGDVDLWRSNPGSVTFTDQDFGVYSSAWHIELATDFNGDGKADVLWRNDNGDIDLWRSNPGSISVTFTDQDFGVYSSAWHIELAADFNGDGKADVLWRNNNGDVDLWRSNPGSISVTFTDQDLGVYSSAWHIEQAADFNGDGKADVLWRNDNGDVDLWRSNPGSISVTFTDQDLGVYSSAWHIEQAADFNGDGKADVLWRNDNGDVDLWRSNPGSISVTFTDQDLGVYSSAWHIEQAADFNGDGKADVLWRNDNGDVDLWRSNPGSISVTFTDQDLGVYSSDWHIT